MRISYIHSICAKNDAISNSIRDEISWLSGRGHDIRFYAHACDQENIPFTKVNSISDIAFDSHFQASDLVVFHFGVYYPLFNLLALTPMGAKRLVVFHNITPRQFVAPENLPLIEQSFQQMANIHFADHVVCDSQTNLTVLREAGIHKPAVVLPLAVHAASGMPDRKPSHHSQVIRLVFIGRFVRSKGPGELLKALHGVLEGQTVRVVLDMIGNLHFSDALVLREVSQAIDALHTKFGSRVQIKIHGNAADETKHQLLRDADALVLPTYHEGFCVPVIEALSQGCLVIAYNNSNIPSISGGFAMLTPTGDIPALTEAMQQAISTVSSDAWRSQGFSAYTAALQAYVANYSQPTAKQRFLDFLAKIVPGA